MDELAAQELELHDKGNQACPVVPTLHSFLGGCVSGIASIVAGQPFDTGTSVRATLPFARAAAAREGARAPHNNNNKATLDSLHSSFCVFLTVKVRMQTSTFQGPMDCLKQLLAKEGPQALFKGMSSPVLSASLVNAIVFSSYNEAMTVSLA